VAESIGNRIKSAWNAFRSKDEQIEHPHLMDTYIVGANRPERPRPRAFKERSIIDSIFTRLSIDFAAVEIRHVRLDKEGRYVSDMDSYLNDCLTVEANLDQGARAFRQDIAMSLFEQGVIAIVPVDTTLNPNDSASYDILTMRVGEIKGWHAQKVTLKLYNERTGKREEVQVDKTIAAIAENPFYSVMNEPNSTLQRLNNKLMLLDVVDEQSSSGKLDIIIQLPYAIKTDLRTKQAETRRLAIEKQLKGSQYGIAYIDGTEKITQLNRPAENNLLAQVEYLTAMVYSQLGLTDEILKGTADEATMLNYQNRTIEPVVAAVVEAMHRRFTTKTGRTQGQAIKYFQDVFKLVPISQVSEIADKLVRNRVVTGNEIRTDVLGWKPIDDPTADQLQNPNMPVQKSPDTSSPTPPEPVVATDPHEEKGILQNGV